MSLPNRSASVAGGLLVLAVAAGIFIGSHGLLHFDGALAGYAIGSLLAAFAVGYRFTVWTQRPPSRLYFRRGFELFLRRVGTAAPATENSAGSNTRSRSRFPSCSVGFISNRCPKTPRSIASWRSERKSTASACTASRRR